MTDHKFCEKALRWAKRFYTICDPSSACSTYINSHKM